MNREEIIRMAREAGLAEFGGCTEQNIERLCQAAYAAGAAAEREACAMRAWSTVLALTDQDTADIVLRAIRARGLA